VQEALRVLEEYARSVDAPLAAEAAAIRYGLYDLEVTCLRATGGNSRRNRLQDCQLCLITAPCPDLIERVTAALRSGVAMVQHRCKSGSDRSRLAEAKTLAALCQDHGALLIINDRIDLALAVDADGVHLGQDDLPTGVARGLIGPDRLLGRSTHDLDQVAEANREDCDYLGLGPVNTTAVTAAAVGTAAAAGHGGGAETAAAHPATAGCIGGLRRDQAEAEHHQRHQDSSQEPAGPALVPNGHNHNRKLVEL